MTLKPKKQLQLNALLEAAEKRVREGGPQALKARELATDIGIALGGLYNLVEDMDMLWLMVADRTMKRLHDALQAASDAKPVTDQASAIARLEAIAYAYLDFARSDYNLWRGLFDIQVTRQDVPEWNITTQLALFDFIHTPLLVLMPDQDEPTRQLRARTLFSATHGIVVLGLEERLIAVPERALKSQLSWIIAAIFG